MGKNLKIEENRPMQPYIHSLYSDLTTLSTRKIYFVPILLGIGIAMYFSWGRETQWMGPYMMASCLGIIAFLLFQLNKRMGGLGPHIIIMAAMLWIVAGFTTASYRAHAVQGAMLSAPIGPVGVIGTVKSVEALADDKGTRVLINRLWIAGTKSQDRPRSLRLSIRKGGEGINVGDRISVFAKIEPPSNPTTPGGFDFRRDAYFKQIGGYGYVLGTPRIIDDKYPEKKTLFTSYVSTFEGMRNAIGAQVEATVGPERAGMVTALLTGERAAIPEDDWDALRDSGLAHLLAISGANVDMVALVVFFMVRFGMALFPTFALHHPIKKYAAVAAGIAATLYVLLIFPSVPTLRALLTVIIVLLAIIFDRAPISLRLVCATAAIVLFFEPYQLLSPSFQLSYAAVTALVAVFEWIAPWLKTIYRDASFLKKIIIYVVGVCGTTVVATIATAPISLYHFQTLALYGVLANLLAVPLMTFIIMPLSILCYVVMPFGMAAPLFTLLGASNEWVLAIAHYTAALPGARLSPPAMPFASFMLIITAGLIVCLTPRYLKLTAIAPVMAAVIMMMIHVYPAAATIDGGKVIMVRGIDGNVYTTSKKFARRTQEDWAKYWGVDPDKTVVASPIQRRIPVRGGYALMTGGKAPNVALCTTLDICTPITGQGGDITAQYVTQKSVVVKPVLPNGQNRLWHQASNLKVVDRVK